MLSKYTARIVCRAFATYSYLTVYNKRKRFRRASYHTKITGRQPFNIDDTDAICTRETQDNHPMLFQCRR